MTHPLATDTHGRLLIDVRGPRFGAAVTSVVIGVAVIVQGPVGVGLLAWQWLMFTIATFAGLRWSPYGQLFRVIKRRFDLGAPPATEPQAPPRFAQACGFVVSSVALTLLLAGATTAGWIAASMVLALSLLLALTGLCVGCELYLVAQRLRARTMGDS